MTSRARGWRPRPLARSLSAMHVWAESGWSGSATATWEFLQSSIVPGPSGAVFVPLSLADPECAPRLARWATVGAVLGGFVAYAIGAHAFDSVGQPLLELLRVSPETLASSQELFRRHGWMLVALSAVSPLSAKLTCIAAGAFAVPVPQFVAAITLGRAARFAVLALVLRYAGERLRARLFDPPPHP